MIRQQVLFNFIVLSHLNVKSSHICNEPLVAYPHLAWCLERKIPVGRRPFSQAGRRRSSFSGDEEQSPPPYPAQGPARPRPRTHFHLTHKSGNGTLLKTKPALHCKYPGLLVFVCVCGGGWRTVYEDSPGHQATLWGWKLLIQSTFLCSLSTWIFYVSKE